MLKVVFSECRDFYFTSDMLFTSHTESPPVHYSQLFYRSDFSGILNALCRLESSVSSHSTRGLYMKSSPPAGM